MYKCSSGSQDATGGPWPYYYFDRAENGSVCVCVHLWAKRFSSTGSTVGGVLKKRRMRRPVCVQPWTKGLTPPLLHRQGGNARLTDIAQRRRCQFVVKQCGTPHCVPAEFSPCCDSTFHVFGSWFFMILPQNLPSAAFVLQLGQLGRADRSFSRLDQQLVETPTSLSDSSPCRSIAFLPIETIALTEKPKFEVCVGGGGCACGSIFETYQHASRMPRDNEHPPTLPGKVSKIVSKGQRESAHPMMAVWGA